MAYIQRQVNCRVAFFACKETDYARRTPKMVLSSSLHQKLEAQSHLFQDVIHIGQLDRQWSYEQLLASLESSLRSRANKCVICFIDGLDECEFVSRKRLIKNLRKLFDSCPRTANAQRIKLIVSSSCNVPSFSK
jgi:hypothetical protein